MDRSERTERGTTFERADALFWEILADAYEAGRHEAAGNAAEADSMRQKVLDEEVPRYREQMAELCGVTIDPHAVPPTALSAAT